MHALGSHRTDTCSGAKHVFANSLKNSFSENPLFWNKQKMNVFQLTFCFLFFLNFFQFTKAQIICVAVYCTLGTPDLACCCCQGATLYLVLIIGGVLIGLLICCGGFYCCCCRNKNVNNVTIANQASERTPLAIPITFTNNIQNNN